MGSFQQISLGIVCLVAAFVFGTYVNNHPPGEQSTAEMSGDLNEGNPPNKIGNVQSRLPLDDLGLVNKRPAPIATMRNPLPPPSQLSLKPPVDSSNHSSGMPTHKQNVAVDPNPGVQVPDFSTIAAEFKNTPIELPPLGSRPSHSNLANNNPPQASPPRLQNLKPKTLPGIAAPSNPGQAIGNDRWNLQAESKLSVDDFAPKLKDRFSNSPIPDQSAQATPERMPSPQSTGDSTGKLQSITAANQTDPPAQIAANSPAQFRIANGALDPNVPYNAARNNQPQSRSIDPQPSERVRSKLPFGLTDQSKGELIRLRSNADSKIALQTTKFVDHVVQSGESLQSISTRYFGKPDYYLDIYLANRKKLRNPAEVPAGITVRVPIYQ